MQLKDSENLKRVTIYGKSVGKYVRSSGLCICHELCISSWGNFNLLISQFQKDVYLIILTLDMVLRHAQWFN